jgi:transcriptional regulator with XRE-family HTH domain
MGDNHPLALARTQRGWSQTQMAAKLCALAACRVVNLATNRNRVWRWESGKASPDATTQALIAELFGVPAEHILERPWPMWLAATTVLNEGMAWTQPGSLSALIDATEKGALDRRGFLALAGSTLLGLADAWASVEPGRLASALSERRVDDDLVGWFENQLPELWRLDDLTGGDTAYALAAAHLSTVVGMLRHGAYTEAQGRRLYRLAAELCRFTGFSSFDAGHHAAAQRYWNAGLRAAHTAEDRALGAYLLSNLALQAVYTGDGRDAVSLLETARDHVDSRASSNVQAMLTAWLARAYAVVGDARRSARTLREADDLFDGDRREDDPAWLYWMCQPSLTAEAGRGVLLLGQPGAAAELLTEGMNALAAESARDRVLYLASLAEARLSHRDVEHAVAHATEALALATNLQSRRCMDLVTDVRDQLAVHRTVSHVADFLERARSA